MSTRLFSSFATRHQRGITLVEMMVAMVVGLILLVGIVQLFISNKQAYRIQEGANVLNENARYLMNQMQYDLRMADHWGGVEASDVEIDGGIAAIGSDCAGDAAALQNAGLYGIDGDDTSPLDCIPSSNYVPNSDIVIVRYGNPSGKCLGGRELSEELQDDEVYIRTAVGRRAVIFQGANKGGLPADLEYDEGTQGVCDGAPDDTELGEYPNTPTFKLKTVIYFLRPCASQALGTAGVCDDADDKIPTLARLSLKGLALVEEDVIAGVEQMQLAYGIDDNGDRAPDRYLSAEDITAGGDWDKVIDVKLSVLIRNTELDTTANDDTQYTLYGGEAGDGVIYTVPDDAKRYRRKVFNTSIQVRNMTRG